jgi:glycosyltransferase involved in cell wall biosynthesis
LIPIFHFRLICKLDIVKTNQLPGAFCAVLVKIFNPHAKVFIRMGYWYSYTQKKKGFFARYIFSILCEAAFFQFADGVIVTAWYISKAVRKQYALSENKVHVIPNSIDIKHYRVIDNIGKKENRFLFIGRIGEEKNLLNAARALKTCGFGLDIIGQGDERIIKSIIEETKIDLNYLGRVPNNELPLLLNKFRYFILPSYYEGCPKSLLEAKACGLVCVGADVDGINEIIEDGKNGYLCGASAKEIEICLRKIRETGDKKRLAINARRTIELKYNFELNYQKEIAIYQI